MSSSRPPKGPQPKEPEEGSADDELAEGDAAPSPTLFLWNATVVTNGTSLSAASTCGSNPLVIVGYEASPTTLSLWLKGGYVSRFTRQ